MKMNLKLRMWAGVAAGLALAVFGLQVEWAQTITLPPPPPTAQESVIETIHGVAVTDPYRWLEDGASPRTRTWIQAQQAYTASLLDHRPGIDSLRQDVTAIANLEQPERVLFRHGRYFILRKASGRQIAALYLREGEAGAERLLIDPANWSKDQSDTLDLLNVSEDGKLMAYGVRRGGRDQISIHFYDVDASKELKDEFPEARYIYWSLPISPDGSRVFYIKFEDTGPRLYEHRFGSAYAQDRLIFGQGIGSEMILSANLSADGNLLLIHVLHGASGSTDLYFDDLRVTDGVKTLVKDVPATFAAESAEGRIFILTNWTASNGRIMVADVRDPSPQHWRILIPEQHSIMESLQLAGGKLLVSSMENAHSVLQIFNATGKKDDDISLPGAGSVETIDSEWNSPVVCFSYTSFQMPPTFFSFSTATRKQTVISGPRIPAQLADVVVDQVWYRSKDGTRVPMFLAHKKDLRKDGDAPVLLYGYGGFRWAQLPTFSVESAVWLEHGGVYAVANIRGGNEFGEAWHRGGELDRKQNSFDDFIAAAQWLIENHYTNPRRLAIQGLSNGGLLVTAALTQYPGLFAAVIGRYPLIDMVRYERFSIARWWTSEYGSVNDPVQFKTLYAYSPYHHVRQGVKYPAVLLVSGEGDTRVDPSHARKMTAMLQNATASGKPVLLLYDSTSGHSGTLSAKAEIKQTVSELEFLEWQLHVQPSS